MDRNPLFFQDKGHFIAGLNIEWGDTLLFLKDSLLRVVLLLFTIAGLAGCSSESTIAAKPAVTPAPQTKTITDNSGRTISLAKTPERIISLSPGNTEILFALGLGEKVIGVTSYCDFPEEAKQKEEIGSFTKIDLEKITSLKPDLILVANIHVKSVLPKLEEQGFTVLVLDPTRLAQVFGGIIIVGRATDKEKEAEDLVRKLNTKYDSINSKVRALANKPSVFYEMSAQLHTTNSDSFIGDIINLAGGTNIAADSKVIYPQFNLETLILKNPDVILLADHGSYGGMTPELVSARDGWSKIAAVKNKRVLTVNPDLISRPGPRVVDGLEEMAKVLHPDVFK